MHVCGSVHMSAQAWASRRVAVSLGAGFVGVCGIPEMGAPQEQHEILTSEPSPYHQLIFSYSNIFLPSHKCA